MTEYFDWSIIDTEILKNLRKECVQARERWLGLLRDYPDDEKLKKLSKEEAANALKVERACTDLIDFALGKKALVGNKGTIPNELISTYRMCYGIST